MFFPKKTKYRKFMKGRIHGINTKGATLSYGVGSVKSGVSGCYGLKALTPGRVTSREIESARMAVKKIARSGRLWIRIFPDIAVSGKPAEVRMGKGKGDIDRWVCRVKPGTIIFEIDGVEFDSAKAALEMAANKLSVCAKVVSILDSGMLV
ncbi:50S ribosomal protein L16 [Candidatus Gromoviella agglomerans]|uniref:50S ribosomal protein L16 n=1 Tax=Candidatus Gromoviella agglomerans TaxID=2806609 RepID=UPI001E2B4215|nr:50S ribosomal protein L16 [Candidatus Gromoviella agglomerans]UFX98566.1 50S ribosomal protein L16 [Candidatus Gromoviella agglomerans]